MKITITGKVPSKKNSKTLLFRNGRPLLLPGNVHARWHRNACQQLMGIKPVKNPYKIEIIVFAGDRRKSDLTNKAESVMDALVDMHIIEDDNWFVIGAVDLKFGGVEKENPRAEITIFTKQG